MTKNTKRRWAKSLVFLSLVFVFGFSGLGSLISPHLGQSTASAAETKNYIFYTGFPKSDQANLKTLKDAIKDNDHENSVFDNTSVRTKGGVFGEKAFELNYDQDKTGCAQAGFWGTSKCSGQNDSFGGPDETLYVYSGEYFCRNGSQIDGPDPQKADYRINYEVSVNLGGDEGAYDGDTLKNNTRLHWVGFGTTDPKAQELKTPGATYYGDVSGSTIRQEEDISISRIPKSCLPLDVPPGVSTSSSRDTQLSNKGIINKFMSIYETTSDATRKIWDTASKKAGLNTAGSAASTGGSSADEPTLECDVKFLNPLSWISCPLIDGLSTVVSELDNLITSQLSVGSPGNGEDPNQIFCSADTKASDVKACAAYHDAWSVFRNLALGLLVVIGLFMILSEIAGMGIFDAYTIRKTLPRLLVGAIAITLSWQLMQFLVEFVNALGYGIRYLIYQPFLNAGIDTATLQGGGKAAVGLLAIGGLFALGVMGMLSFVATAAIGVIIALLTLVVREIIIIACVLIAPVAIVLYILPNTERYFKLWWDTFFKALMMFPLIAAMIASGRVFAALASNGNTISQILGFAAYFAPYFLMPMTFKYSGAAISGIGSFFNNNGVSNWGRQKLGAYRSQKAAKNWQDTKDFSRFSDRSALGRGLNNVGGAVTNRAFRPKKYRSRKEVGKASYGARTLKESDTANIHAGDDNVQLALASRGLAEQKLSDAHNDFEARTRAVSLAEAAHRAAPTAATQATLEQAEQKLTATTAEIEARQHGLDVADSMGPEAKSLGVRRQALSNLAKTGFQFKEGEDGYKELRGIASELSAGDSGAMVSIMNEAQYGLRTAGRYDLGGINNGAGYDPKGGTDKASLYELANAKKETIHGMLAGAADGTLEDQAVLHQEFKAMLPSSKGAARDAILKGIDNLEQAGVVQYMAQETGRTKTINTDKGPRLVKETRGDIVGSKARTYERPDPNRI